MKLTDTFLSCHLPCMFCDETSGAIFLTLEGTRRIFLDQRSMELEVEQIQ